MDGKLHTGVGCDSGRRGGMGGTAAFADASLFSAAVAHSASQILFDLSSCLSA
ncbi:hypothetical protein RSSM_03732 [Rhodopirellula sallentina SM41]|uniref:Uncharacterized protein n=1 Tax=Rhodopirellula sallentina SM41 TaxID=1263870 RepID=M5UFN3_9BACT|nr:hypothetical protein RSSM_03732 [Rhodopirellula sallentina SM41]